ncbi:MAG: RagB/SusD family nutrient uptake outer membrane protein [Dysgonamonadaceae bacterium]|jgi:hypothetical protein|nr:RagB/SusD family nutrient uptake outer membrane protein [Dysgonamonadaceae bacterium]
MKKIFYIIACVLLFTSCEDFLDTPLLTSKTNENYPGTEQEANEMLTGVYSHLLFQDPEVSSQFFVAQLASDECLGGNLTTSNCCAMNFLMYTSLNLFLGYYESGNLVPGVWDRCYKLIYRANTALEAFEKFEGWSSLSEKNRHLGEVYFLRAYSYYELTRIFGEVPIRLKTDMEKIGRSPVDEVYELIASDLKNAIELMPAKSYLGDSPMAGHATKYAAEALMARVFLFYTGRYAKSELPGGITKQQVITWIDDCVNNSGHDLVKDQRSLWAYSNPASEDNDAGYRYKYVIDNKLDWAGLNSIETVFANKHNLKNNSWTYTWFCNTVAQFMSPPVGNNTATSMYPFGTGWGGGPVSPALVSDWKSWSANQTFTDGYTEDPRLTGSIWGVRAYDFNDATKVLLDCRLTDNEPDYIVTNNYCEQTGYYQKKYINVNSYQGANTIRAYGLQLYPDIAPGVYSNSLNNISDLITIRFADVLLMQSELKEDATGLNRVRARSHLAPVAYSLDAIKNERRYELVFESIRWWDLLRWSGPSLDEAGDALNKQTGFQVINESQVVPMVQYDYKKRLKEMQGYWYVPQSEIELSNGLIEQNPGWGPEAMYKNWYNM